MLCVGPLAACAGSRHIGCSRTGRGGATSPPPGREGGCTSIPPCLPCRRGRGAATHLPDLLGLPVLLRLRALPPAAAAQLPVCAHNHEGGKGAGVATLHSDHLAVFMAQWSQGNCTNRATAPAPPPSPMHWTDPAPPPRPARHPLHAHMLMECAWPPTHAAYLGMPALQQLPTSVPNSTAGVHRPSLPPQPRLTCFHA